MGKPRADDWPEKRLEIAARVARNADSSLALGPAPGALLVENSVSETEQEQDKEERMARPRISMGC
jgi:hypothetical protein